MVVGEERVYRVEAVDGRVEHPVLHIVIVSEDHDSYKLVEVDGSYCGDIL